MTDKGVGKGTDNGLDNGFDMEADAEVLNRNELMQLPGKELAKKAAPYSHLKLSTLERKSRAELCDIILNKGQQKPDDEKPNARAARSSSETEQLIETALTIMDALKTNRDNEPLHRGVKETFKKQAVVYADNKINNDQLDINKANTSLLVLTGAAILYDGIIGFSNTPTLLAKVKNKFFPGQKEANKQDDPK